MTEQEWLTCTDPQKMLEVVRDRASDRKFRLYLCGGCRCINHLFFSPRSLAAVEVAERFGDGQATLEELDSAEWAAEAATFGYEFRKDGWSYSSPAKTRIVPRLVEMGVLPESALSGGEWQVEDAVRQRLLAAATLAERCAVHSPRTSEWGLWGISLVDWPNRWLFDCVFGNPYLSVTIDSTWLTWNDGTVGKIAQAIYEDRAFERLPILADALEEAGCADAGILAHCRGPGPHVRGCFVLDLLLGKE